MEHRIIKETKCNKYTYKIQYKFLFWWITETYVDYSIDGLSGVVDLTFNSLKEAEDYVYEQYGKPIIEVIKVIK